MPNDGLIRFTNPKGKRGACRTLLALIGLPIAALCVFSAGLLAQRFSPTDAPKRMTMADGFQVKLVAAEPLVRQPVCIEFDDRGRLWVVQYLQYPNLAGLKRVKVDRYSRTVYDRVPEPPPHGPKGADRITILLDPDQDGRMTRTKDFLSNLNLATGIAFTTGAFSYCKRRTCSSTPTATATTFPMAIPTCW